MRYRKLGAAALLTAAGAVAAIGAAPAALADSCDPAVTVCDGGEIQPTTSGTNDFSPTVTAPDEGYPSDGDFFYNSPGPNEPAYSTGNGPGGRGGGGGHH